MANTHASPIRARPTTYNGIRMRSRLEADYAAWLDKHGYRWEYEPDCFASVGGQWLPDFGWTFADHGGLAAYVELKPAGPLLAYGVGSPEYVAHASQYLDRLTIAWASRPDAMVELVFWEFGARESLHLFSLRAGRRWFAWNDDGTSRHWPEQPTQGRGT